MIGILKSLGLSNISVRRIFFHVSTQLLFKGLLFGNSIGIGFCWLQLHFKIISLPAAIYYLTVTDIKNIIRSNYRATNKT